MRNTLQTVLAGMATLIVAGAAHAQLNLPGAQPQQQPAQGQGQEANLPAAQELINRHIEATGGREVHDKVKSIHMKGTMSVPAQGLEGSLEVWQKPGKMLSVFEIPQLERQVQGITDGVAWETSVNQGARVIEGAEKAMLERSNDMQIYLHPEKYYQSMQTVRTDTYNGNKVFVVEMQPKVGETERQFFDANSGLLVKSELTADSPMGKIPMQIAYEDYGQTDGLKLSKRQVITFGPAKLIAQMKNIEINPDIPDEKFAMPEEIKGMLDR